MYVSIVLVLLLVLHSSVDCMTKNGTKTCSQLTTVSQNIPQTLILKNPAQGHNLKICQSNLTCCSKQMENELYMKSSRVLKDAVHQQTNTTHHFLTTQASLFDGYFKNLLKVATAKWHKMLFLTYKEMYTPNRYIFDEFFSSLYKYYVNGDVDQLDKSFDVFFQRIQSTMITLINKTLASQPGFLNCTSRRIAEIQPFGMYQSKITNQLKPSLVQARTLVVGLRAGSNTTASIINYLTRNECGEIFTKMQHCSVCEGIPNALACNATCHNILYSCFALDPLVHASWSDFIRGVDVLSFGIDSQYNFEAIVGQLAFDISYAIMEFQNNFISVFSKALKLCPLGNRKKRAIDRSGSDLYLEGERMRRSQDFLFSLPLPTKQQPAIPLSTFTAAFRKQLNGMKYVWEDLPQKICGGQTFVSRDHNASCWNGIEMQKNSDNVPSLKLSSIDSRQLWIPVSEQLLKLKQIVGSVRGAAGDNDEESASGEPDYSGSGSGSGSVDWSGSGDLSTTVSTPGITTPSTDQILVVTSTTVRSILGDEEDGSGEKYTTTLSSTTEDDEDFRGGSGSETPMIENEIMSKPTDPDILTNINLVTKPEDNVPGGSGNMMTISYFSVILVTLVGLM